MVAVFNVPHCLQDLAILSKPGQKNACKQQKNPENVLLFGCQQSQQNQEHGGTVTIPLTDMHLYRTLYNQLSMSVNCQSLRKTHIPLKQTSYLIVSMFMCSLIRYWLMFFSGALTINGLVCVRCCKSNQYLSNTPETNFTISAETTPETKNKTKEI